MLQEKSYNVLLYYTTTGYVYSRNTSFLGTGTEAKYVGRVPNYQALKMFRCGPRYSRISYKITR